MRKTALTSTCLALGLLPVVAYFVWPRPALIALVGAMGVPLSLTLAALALPDQALLRWAALITNLLIALLMAFGFTYMLLHVGRAPPNLLEASPVVLAAFVMLFVPVINLSALAGRRR
jgi:hypothetical protein